MRKNRMMIFANEETSPKVASAAARILKMMPKLHQLLEDIESVAASALTQARAKKSKSRG